MKRIIIVLLAILMTTTCFNALAERTLLFEIAEADEEQNNQEEAKDIVRLTDFLARYAWLCEKFDIEYRIAPTGVAPMSLLEDNTYRYLSVDMLINSIDPETFDIGTVYYDKLRKYPEDAKRSMAVIYSMVNIFWWQKAGEKNAMESRFAEHYLEDYENLKEASANGWLDLGNGYSAIYIDGVTVVTANKLIQ